MSFFFPKCLSTSTEYRHTLEILQVWVQLLRQSEHCTKASYNLFAGGGSGLQFLKTAASVKCNKPKSKKTRYACIRNNVHLKNY